MVALGVVTAMVEQALLSVRCCKGGRCGMGIGNEQREREEKFAANFGGRRGVPENIRGAPEEGSQR